jgi:hypothetical protein
LRAFQRPLTSLREAEQIWVDGDILIVDIGVGTPHDKAAEVLCSLLNRIEALAEQVGRDNIENRFIIRDAVAKKLLVEFDAEQYWLTSWWSLKVGDRDVHLIYNGDEWVWVDDSTV